MEKLKKSTNKRLSIQIYQDFLESDLLDNCYQKLIYIYLKSFADLNNQCSPSLKTLSKLTKISVSQVRRTLADLEKKGVIAKENRIGIDDGYISNLYTLFDYKDIWRMDSNSIDKINTIKKKETKVITKNKKILRKSSCNSQGIIYIMKNCGYYKIGRALSETRLGEYTKLPEEPEYIVKEIVYDYGSVELSLHEMFKTKRLRDKKCEWFDLTNEDIKKAKKYISNFTVKNAS